MVRKFTRTCGRRRASRKRFDDHQFDAAFGGGRRDEEKSRAKERVFSFRNSAPPMGSQESASRTVAVVQHRKHKGENTACFDFELDRVDVWLYIHKENIPVVPLYLSAPRPVVERNGTLIMGRRRTDAIAPRRSAMIKSVRFRTLGCYPLTGAVESNATTMPEVIMEMLLTNTSERQGRLIDHDTAASMEKKKQEGYF